MVPGSAEQRATPPNTGQSRGQSRPTRGRLGPSAAPARSAPHASASARANTAPSTLPPEATTTQSGPSR
jgi:hypothetical protein